MRQIILITFKGIFRDRVFRGIAMSALFFLLIPAISPLSMRQVAQLSITLSLSLISFMMLLLSVFLGGSSLWRDMERRYTYSVLGLPLTRTSYLLGKFLGISAYLLLTTLILGSIGCAVIKYVSILYPPILNIIWTNVFLSIFFIALKYILLVAIAFLLSTVSTSFFLPIFGSLAVFFAGSALQQVYDYLRSESAQSYSPFIKYVVSVLYYILPNFKAFDLSVNAIYSIDLSLAGLMLTSGYFFIYTTIILTCASLIFSRREFQ
jgi:ABC-type transport system involved in multi-copper enzyme maturation permease subunit